MRTRTWVGMALAVLSVLCFYTVHGWAVAQAVPLVTTAFTAPSGPAEPETEPESDPVPSADPAPSRLPLIEPPHELAENTAMDSDLVLPPAMTLDFALFASQGWAFDREDPTQLTGLNNDCSLATNTVVAPFDAASDAEATELAESEVLSNFAGNPDPASVLHGSTRLRFSQSAITVEFATARVDGVAMDAMPDGASVATAVRAMPQVGEVMVVLLICPTGAMDVAPTPLGDLDDVVSIRLRQG